MRSAPITKDESARLKDLYDYEILDTASEKVFDDLTALASEICQTPIALISLVDPDRQWFKSKVGIDAEETSRDIAFCAHAIHQREIFEVKDTLQDERFFDNPLVTAAPNIRFYAGAQLVTPDNHAIGTLCAISDKPMSLSQQQKDALEILSREVISQMELRLKIKQLKQADQRKTDYLSNLSHELRTPLNAIVCYSRLLKEKFDQLSLPAEIGEFVINIDNSSQHLLEMINSVLDLHKIEEGKMVLTPGVFACEAFFHELQSIVQAKADQRQVILLFDYDPSLPEMIEADKAKLKQVLINLLTNAIKFTDAHHHVLLEAKQSHNKLIVVVEDQGCGIPLDEQDKLFDKFYQVGKSGRTEGTGLGLVISKGLAELMDGNLTLTSEPGKGTCITLELPLNEPSVQSACTDVDKSTLSYSKEARILVVEDNVINQQVAQFVFESIGLCIDIAETGETAVEQVDQHAYQLIFMDLHLPGIDGFETTNRILSKYPSLPVVALSADVFAQTNEKATQAGMKDILGKPIDKDELIRILHRFVPN